MVLLFWWSRITSKDKVWALFNFFRTELVKYQQQNCARSYLTIYIYIVYGVYIYLNIYIYIYIYIYIDMNKHHHCGQPMHFWRPISRAFHRNLATRRCCRAMVCNFAQRSLKKFQIHCDRVVLVELETDSQLRFFGPVLLNWGSISI